MNKIHAIKKKILYEQTVLVTSCTKYQTKKKPFQLAILVT